MKEIIIDGVPGTWEESETPPEPQPKFNAAAFYDAIRSALFGGSMNQGQVNGCNRIGAACWEHLRNHALDKSAYVLATVYHETAHTMQPIAEYGGKNARYAPWYGRGDVQLTWEENYEKQQAKLGDMVAAGALPEDFVYQVHDNRELALNPDTSAVICVCGMRDGDFTGKKLASYINDNGTDFVNARRIVNGTDRADLIAGYAHEFQIALRAGASG